MKLLITAGMALLCGSSIAQDNTTHKLDEMVTAYASQGRFNGSVLVAKEGNILLQKGYGYRDAARRLLNDAATQYQIASITKSFTSTVILKLVESGKMFLNDKLSRYYSGFPHGDSITIQHLLTHTSGLHSYTEEDSTITETDERRMIPYLKTLKPDYVPGTRWHYSNSGYAMLGYIIQKVSGLTYWQAVHQYIFAPLQMNNSGFDFVHLNRDHKSIGYDVLNDSVHTRAIMTDSTVPFAAGAIYSTVSDLYRFQQGLQRRTIVGNALLDKAWQSCPLNSYGYGWQIDSIYGRKMVSHSGSITGFGSNFAMIPADDICIILLSNRSGSTFEVTNITKKLLAILYDRPVVVPVKRTPLVLNEAVLKRYTGRYELTGRNLLIDLTFENGQLLARPHGGPVGTMLAINEKRFYLKEDAEMEITMLTDETGRVTGFELLQGDRKGIAKKIK